MYDQLKSVWNQTGIQPVQLMNIKELPEVFEEVWGWFLRLNATRSSGFGANPIQFIEMKAFFELNCIRPELWELIILERIDRKFLNLAIKQSAKESKK